MHRTEVSIICVVILIYNTALALKHIFLKVWFKHDISTMFYVNLVSGFSSAWLSFYIVFMCTWNSGNKMSHPFKGEFWSLSCDLLELSWQAIDVKGFGFCFGHKLSCYKPPASLSKRGREGEVLDWNGIKYGQRKMKIRCNYFIF